MQIDREKTQLIEMILPHSIRLPINNWIIQNDNDNEMKCYRSFIYHLNCVLWLGFNYQLDLIWKGEIEAHVKVH